MNEFKIRASAASKIAGVKGLGETGKTYCKQWLKEQMYNRRADIKSKYIDKGNETEEEGFTLMAVELGLGMVYKNQEFFNSDIFCGTPDLIHNGVVYDNKSSWSLDTFPMFESEVPNKDYWWQLQVYMELTGCKRASLVYTLNDAGSDLLAQATKWESDPEKIYRILVNMIYTKDTFDKAVAEFCPFSKLDYFMEIPDSKRIKTFSFDYDADAIMLLKSRVVECRTYINSLLNNK